MRSLVRILLRGEVKDFTFGQRTPESQPCAEGNQASQRLGSDGDRQHVPTCVT